MQSRWILLGWVLAQTGFAATPKNMPPPRPVHTDSTSLVTARRPSIVGAAAGLSYDVVVIDEGDASISMGGLGLSAQSTSLFYLAERLSLEAGVGLHIWNVAGEDSTGFGDDTLLGKTTLKYSVQANNFLAETKGFYAINQAMIGLTLKYESLASGRAKTELGQLSTTSKLTQFSALSTGIALAYAHTRNLVFGGYVCGGEGAMKVSDGERIDIRTSELAATAAYYF